MIGREFWIINVELDDHRDAYKNKEMTKRVLIIAPHPDDEVLGCGGNIKRMTNEGIEVFVVIVTRGKAGMFSEERILNVRSEARNAHKILGISETVFFDFPAPYLDQVSLADISIAISEVLQNYGIDTVYLPHFGDLHNDHKVTFSAGLVACRPLQGTRVKNIYSYETLSETEWAAPFSDNAFVPTRFVNITDFIDAKLDAMKCYKSQIKEFPNSRSFVSIKALAQLRGSTVGFHYAESFMIVRLIE